MKTNHRKTLLLQLQYGIKENLKMEILKLR